jgi:hypothetical protein
MKKHLILLLILGLLIVQSSFAQSKSVANMYQKYQSNPDFFHLDLGGNFMNFAKGMNIELNDEGANLLSNSVERIKMFRLPSSNASNEFRALVKGLEKENFELMMEAGKRTSNIQVFTKGSNRIKDVVVLVAGDSGEHMVFELVGDFDSASLASLSKNFN